MTDAARPGRLDPRLAWIERDAAFVGLLLVLATLLAYMVGVTGGTFHFDDFHNLRDNPSVRTLANLPRFFTDASTWSELPGNTMYRPVQMVTYALDHAIWGYRPAGWLTTNVLLHAAVAVLVWRLARRIGLSPLASLLAGLVMALHPVHSEVVNYVSSRSESLAALFVLLALHAHLTARASTGAGRFGWGAAAALCSALALGSKETAACFFLAVAWMEFVLPRPGAAAGARVRAARALAWGAAYAVVFVAVMAVRSAVLGRATADVHVLSTPAGADLQSGGSISVLDNVLFTQSRVVVLYHRLLALPFGLNVDHDVSRAADPSASSLAALAIHAAVVVWAVVALLRGRRLFPLCVGWFWLFLAPSVAFPLNVVMNEHRLYLPGIAVALLGGAALARVADAIAVRRPGIAGPWWAAAPLFLFAALDVQRSLDWRSDLELWTVAVARDDTPRARMHLGAAWVTTANEQSDPAERLSLLRMGLAQYEIAATRHAAWYDLQLNLGTTHVMLGHLTGDRSHYESALRAFTFMARLHPGQPRPRYLQTEPLTMLGRYDEALDILRELRAADATVTTLYDDAEARILRRKGDLAAARAKMADVLAVEAEPTKRIDALLTLGGWAFEDGDLGAAQGAVSAAMELAVAEIKAGRSRDARPWLYVARMLVQLREPGAEEYLEKARQVGWDGNDEEMAWVRGGPTPGALRGTAGMPRFRGGR